nr:hypothetical protein [Tanacetum cinerariifolium]
SDDDEELSLNLNADEEEENQEDEYGHNADMTNAKQDGEDQHNASHELGFVQEEEDAHVTLTTVHDKTKRPMKSSLVSSDFTNFSSIFKFNKRVTNLERELLEMKQVDQYAQAISFIPVIVDRYVDNKLEEAIQKAIR